MKAARVGQVRVSADIRDRIASAQQSLDDYRLALPFVSFLLAHGVLEPREADAVDLAEYLAATLDPEVRSKVDAADGPAQDLAIALAAVHARAGYLLGLAVGQQLAPGAFGGAR